MTRCPDEQTLLDFAKGELAEADAAATEAHLESCKRCAAVLDRLSIGRDMIEQIRDLHRSRKEIETALSKLEQTQRNVSTTLFGWT